MHIKSSVMYFKQTVCLHNDYVHILPKFFFKSRLNRASSKFLESVSLAGGSATGSLVPLSQILVYPSTLREGYSLSCF